MTNNVGWFGNIIDPIDGIFRTVGHFTGTSPASKQIRNPPRRIVHAQKSLDAFLRDSATIAQAHSRAAPCEPQELQLSNADRDDTEDTSSEVLSVVPGKEDCGLVHTKGYDGPKWASNRCGELVAELRWLELEVGALAHKVRGLLVNRVACLLVRGALACPPPVVP